MEIGNNPYSYYVDFQARANAQHNAVSKEQGHEHDTRGLEKNNSSDESKNNPQQTGNTKQDLTADERVELNKLQAIDAKVRAHEAAHQSGAAAAGGASFSYAKGPDGVMYATGGEVPVRLSSGATPQESITNAQAAIATALAPADPSPQDISVASQARVMLMKAQQEFAQEIQEKISQSNEYAQKALGAYEENSDSNSEEKSDDIIA